MTDLYVKELYDAGKFDVTLVTGERVRPSVWRSKVISVQETENVVEQMKFPEMENQAVSTGQGTSPYYFRVDLMTMLLLPSVTMYDPNYISRLGTMDKDDDFVLTKDGVYTLTGEEYYRKDDVLRMASKFMYLGNAHGTEFEIPPMIATNVLGFTLLDKYKTMYEYALEVRRSETNFMRLAIDIAAWPIEALLIDLAIMSPEDWDDMYSNIVQLLIILLMTGLVESVDVTEDNEALSAAIVGVYSPSSTSIRAHSITYDAMRVKYVSKFAQILMLELVRLGFRDASPPMSEAMRMFEHRTYELINTSRGQSEQVIDTAIQDIVELTDLMQAHNEDTIVLETMLDRKRRELSLEACSKRKVASMRSATSQYLGSKVRHQPTQMVRSKNTNLVELGIITRHSEDNFIADILEVGDGQETQTTELLQPERPATPAPRNLHHGHIKVTTQPLQLESEIKSDSVDSRIQQTKKGNKKQKTPLRQLRSPEPPTNTPVAKVVAPEIHTPETVTNGLDRMEPDLISDVGTKKTESVSSFDASSMS